MLLPAGPAAAQDIVPPKQYTVTPGGLNLSDGSLVHSVTDLSLGTLTLERFHRSGIEQPNYPMFGKNFSSNFDIYLAKMRTAGNPYDKLIVHIGNSASGTYQQYQGSSIVTGINADAGKGVLAWSGSNYVYTDSSGTVYTFSGTVAMPGVPSSAGSMKVERIDFPDGRVQSFSYDSGGHLKLVEDSAGYAMVFAYNAGGDVSAACAFVRSQTYVSASSTCTGATLKTSYTYVTASPRNLLATATDVFGKETIYTNTVQGVTCMKPPDFDTCPFILTDYQVADSSHAAFSVTQTMADGAVWLLAGADESQNPPGNREDIASDYNGARRATLIDPAGETTKFLFTKSSPYTVEDPNGHITSFHFEGAAVGINGGTWTGSMLLEATYPEGDKYQAEYDGPFRAITKERHVAKDGSSALEKEYGYASCTSPGTYQNCAKPIWIEDPAGNRTHFTYAGHGGVLTEMGPPPTEGGARPLKVTTWVQRHPWTRNSSNNLVEVTSASIWVKTSETVCQTVAGTNPSPTCDANAAQTVTTYEYGTQAQALLIKGVVVTADGQSLRTCYGYDALDRKISETQPNANCS